MSESPAYGTVYRHTYPGSCRAGGRDLLKSETGKYRGAIACRACRDWLRAVEATFAVIKWRADGVYRLEDAIATYARPSLADRHASRLYAADPASPYVARTFTRA